MSELCRVMGIKKTSTTAFHPQGNGRCERVNRTILGMLAKYMSGNHDQWDHHLPLLMLGYRAQIHKSLGYSPFFMMFGREPGLPIDTEIDSPSTARARSAAEYIDELCAGLRTVYSEAIRISDGRHRQNKQLYDRKLNTFHYNAGDRAMLFRGIAKRGEYHKFLRPWKPVVIVARRGDLNYRVRLEDGKMLCVHHNRLKPCTVPPSSTSGSDTAADGTTDPVSSSAAGERTIPSADVSEVETAVSPLAEERDSVPLTVRPIPLPRQAASVHFEMAQRSTEPSPVDGLESGTAPLVAPRRSTRERHPPDRYQAGS